MLLGKACTDADRFELIDAARELDHMRRRWRARLLKCSPFSHHVDKFLWDDGIPLQAHPYRLRAIAEELRLEQRQKQKITDWAEALPEKVLLCNDPQIMLVLENWDTVIAPVRSEPLRSAEPAVCYVSGLCKSETRLGAITGKGLSIPKQTQPPAPKPAVVHAELVYTATATRPDMVGCYKRKPCIMTLDASKVNART